jgi:hypothetical protein
VRPPATSDSYTARGLGAAAASRVGRCRDGTHPSTNPIACDARRAVFRYAEQRPPFGHKPLSMGSSFERPCSSAPFDGSVRPAGDAVQVVGRQSVELGARHCRLEYSCTERRLAERAVEEEADWNL